MNSTKLKINVQATLCTAHEAKDSGDFVFVICRRGLSRALGRRLQAGEKFIVDIVIREVDNV